MSWKDWNVVLGGTNWGRSFERNGEKRKEAE